MCLILSLRTEQSTEATWTTEFARAPESRPGRMERGTKATGTIIELSVKENSGILMATFTMVNGLTTKPMDMVSTGILTGLSMRVSGSMICKMAKAWKLGLMVVATREVTSKA